MTNEARTATKNHYDAIVVGARAAGAPTAMLLARKGYRVLLVDRATFPSDTMSTHMLHLSNMLTLERWGLLDRVAASNCPAVSELKFDIGGLKLFGYPAAVNGIRSAYQPRRYVLDKILVDAAREAGAELREGFTFQNLLFDGDRVVGISGRQADGRVVEERARIVIGADGKHSLVARLVGAQEYNVKPALSCAYYSYFSGVPMSNAAEVYIRDGRAVIAAPTNDDRTIVIAQWSVEGFDEFRKDIEGNFMKTLELVPEFAARVQAGQREERFIGTADLRNFFRTATGPGWALAGDARYHRDPTLGQGIGDGFNDADALAQAIDDAFAGGLPIEDTLARYHRERDASVLPMYEMVTQMAPLAPPPAEAVALMSALVGNQRRIDQYLGIIEGTTRIEQFFSPDNIAAIFAEAAPIAEKRDAVAA